MNGKKARYFENCRVYKYRTIHIFCIELGNLLINELRTLCNGEYLKFLYFRT